MLAVWLKCGLRGPGGWPMSLPAEKRCPRCEETKPCKTGFYGWTDKRTGNWRWHTYCRECVLEKTRERASSPEYREKRRERDRKRWQDPEYRERQNARMREYDRWRRSWDAEYLETRRANSRDWKRRNEARARAYSEEYRERIRRDDELRRRRNQQRRERYAIQRDREGGGRRLGKPRGDRRDEFLPIEPFREWLRWYLDQEREPDAEPGKELSVAYRRIAWATGVSETAASRAVYRWLNESEHIPLGLADAVLTKLDSPARLYELWPELAGEAAA